jgi:hypothetical protein
MLAALLDLRNPLHRLDCGLHQLAIIANRDVSPLFEVDSRILTQSQIRSRWLRELLTMVISFPAALRKAFVQRTLRGLRFILRGGQDAAAWNISIAHLKFL